MDKYFDLIGECREVAKEKVNENKSCPKCGHRMSYGAPHGEGPVGQWECHSCGYVEPGPLESKTNEDRYICIRCGSTKTAEIENKIKCLNCGHIEELPGEKLSISAPSKNEGIRKSELEKGDKGKSDPKGKGKTYKIEPEKPKPQKAKESSSIETDPEEKYQNLVEECRQVAKGKVEEKKVDEQDEEPSKEEPTDAPPPPEEVKEPETGKLEARKEYLGKSEDTHYYFVVAEGEADKPEDLLIVDQEGVKKYSARDHNMEVSEEGIADFIIKAIQDVKIDQIERSVFMKYILPKLEEETPRKEEVVEEPEEKEKPKEAKPEGEKPEKEEPTKIPPEEPVESKKVVEKQASPEIIQQLEELYTAIKNRKITVLEATGKLFDIVKALGKEGLSLDEIDELITKTHRAILQGVIEGKNVREIKEYYGLDPYFSLEDFADELGEEEDLHWEIDGEYSHGEKGHLSITLGGIPGARVGADEEFDGSVNELFSSIILSEKGRKLAGGKVSSISVSGVAGRILKALKRLARKNKIEFESLDEGKSPICEMKVTDDEGNIFDVRLVDDGPKDTTISINEREFKFDSEFTSYWRDKDGTLTDEGLKELALDALANIEPEEYDELVVKGEKEEVEEANSYSKQETDDELRQKFYDYMSKFNFPTWKEGIKSFAKQERMDPNELEKKLSHVLEKFDYIHKTPGIYKVTFYDGHTEELEGESKVDAKAKAEKIYPESKVSHVEMLQATEKEEDIRIQPNENKLDQLVARRDELKAKEDAGTLTADMKLELLDLEKRIKELGGTVESKISEQKDIWIESPEDVTEGTFVYHRADGSKWEIIDIVGSPEEEISGKATYVVGKVDNDVQSEVSFEELKDNFELQESKNDNDKKRGINMAEKSDQNKKQTTLESIKADVVNWVNNVAEKKDLVDLWSRLPEAEVKKEQVVDEAKPEGEDAETVAKKSASHHAKQDKTYTAKVDQTKQLGEPKEDADKITKQSATHHAKQDKAHSFSDPQLKQIKAENESVEEANIEEKLFTKQFKDLAVGADFMYDGKRCVKYSETEYKSGDKVSKISPETEVEAIEKPRRGNPCESVKEATEGQQVDVYTSAEDKTPQKATIVSYERPGEDGETTAKLASGKTVKMAFDDRSNKWIIREGIEIDAPEPEEDEELDILNDEVQDLMDEMIDSEDNLDEAKKKKLVGKKGRPLKKGAAVRARGDCVFPHTSPKVTDNKDHFPINSENQARNALARANQYKSAPKWYKGNLESLVKTVARRVKSKYPDIKVTKAAETPGKGPKESLIPVENEQVDITERKGLERLNQLLGLNG